MTLLKNLDNGVTTPLLGNGYRSSETSLMSAEDDEIASDIDDDVFIKTGRTQHKFVEDEVKKPLMPPRKKTSSKTDTFQTDVVTTKPSSLCLPVCYGIVALIALIGSLGVVSIAVVYLSSLYDAKWNSSNEKIFTKYPWKHIKSSNVWQQSAPQYELGVSQTFDANNDSIVDLVIGFSTVPGSYLENTDNNLICEIYFDGLKTCGGGVRVLDGRKGNPIWVYWTPHPVREVSCGVDLTQDGIKDCVLSDKKENVVCVNGANGAVLWKYHPIQSATSLSFCQLNDVDYDLLPDFLLVINQPPAAMGKQDFSANNSQHFVRWEPDCSHKWG